jgi:RHS repeat-associated protein
MRCIRVLGLVGQCELGAKKMKEGSKTGQSFRSDWQAEASEKRVSAESHISFPRAFRSGEKAMIKNMSRLMALSFAVLSGPLVAQTPEETVRYIHTDALGSVVAVSDEAGNIVERREYEPFGAQLTPVLVDGPGYTGHVQDSATGLTYMQQRYYDPQIGRFLSVDPVTAYGGDPRHFNRYPYAFNNPYRFTDPDGRRSRQDHQRKDWSSITAKSPGAAAQMATSAHAGNLPTPSRSPQGTNNSSGATPSGATAATQETGWSASSILTGDTTVTATGVAALGVGLKAEKASGPGNDKVSVVTLRLGYRQLAR